MSSDCYKAKGAVHGFSIGKSIVTNAASHTQRRFVLNIDLRLFGSINLAGPRNAHGKALLPGKMRYDLGSIVHLQAFFPQGAPTSPIITNMIVGVLTVNSRSSQYLPVSLYQIRR